MKYIKRKSVIKVPIESSIIDTTNINDKISNTYSANTIDNLFNDSLPETMSNDNGVAEKYPDGRLICNHFIDLGTGCAFTKQYGSVYYMNSVQVGWTFPYKFKEIPYVQATAYFPGGLGGVCIASYPTVEGINTLYPYYTQSYTFTNAICGVFVRAEGKWK